MTDERAWDSTANSRALAAVAEVLRPYLGDRPDLRDIAVDVLDAAFTALDAVDEEYLEPS